MSCPRLFEPVDAEHLATCAECRAAHAALDGSVPAGASLESLKASALAELKAHPKARPWYAGAIGFTVVSVIAATLAMQLLVPNTTQHGSMTLREVSAAAWAVMMLAGCFLAVMPGARGGRMALLVGLGACFGLTLYAASGSGPPGLGNVGCALTESAVALVPLAVALAVLTGFAFDVTRALAAGVGAMSAGMLALHLHCPNGTPAHQAAFHLAPILVLALLAVLVRRRMPSRTHAP